MTKEQVFNFLDEIKNHILEKHPELKITTGEVLSFGIETSDKLRISVDDEKNKLWCYVDFEDNVEVVKNGKREVYYRDGKRKWRPEYDYIHDGNFHTTYINSYKINGFKLLCEVMEYIEKNIPPHIIKLERNK